MSQVKVWKLRLASGIFIFLTVFKLLLPEQAGRFRDELVQVIDLDMDLRSAAIAVGAHMTDDNVQQVLHLLPEKPEAMPESEAAPTPVPGMDEPGPSPELSVKPEERVLQAVAAFQLSQEAYAGYTQPENVRYDSLVLPFSYVSPIDGVKSSGFGYRIHPIEQVVKFHYGTDYGAPEGTPVVAFADGEVDMTGSEQGYGNYVRLTHSGGWQTLYAHCSEIQVEAHAHVERGQTIALSGATGHVTGPHLHFELMHDGLYTNPEFFF